MGRYFVDWGYFLAVDVPGLGAASAQAQTYIVSIGQHKPLRILRQLGLV